MTKHGGRTTDDDGNTTASVPSSNILDDTSPMLKGEAWLLALQRHENEAWSQLFRLFAEQLHQDIQKSMYKFQLPVEDAHDVLQDTICTAMNLIGNFEWQSEDKLYNWLRSISYNHVRTMNKAKDWLSFEAIEATEDGGDSMLDVFMRLYGLFNDGPEHEFDLYEQLSMIFDAMRQLSERDAEIFTRWWINDEKPRHIAEDYDNLKPEYISTIIHRAKERIHMHVSAQNLFKDNQK